ncbi:hypothetical protein O3G_MSEX014051 [Manduca sexta]|uniref:Uncharacterized protein n=1 Tax=Manduca sexta TaxID=7130 RepID=A0A921ZTA4_MANSE|nr:hypothetical protein O3G_MSEX014051 [Manduca sexta]KAG6463768.1 hypothetical protein O3G_MSEX014051 [Manduca sexta]
MKPSKGSITSSRSCSSSTCLYRSESDRPSLRRIIAQGSKIDKLYYGKYIPLRERKLLDKLVRTRAVYDDIRTQLLSGSSTSVSLADLKPRRKIHSNRMDKNAQKGDDIPALVDLVDKGNVLHSENSSDCCSCCLCGSELGIENETTKTHVHKHKRRDRARMTSKSSVMSRQRAGEETKPGKAVHFKTKHIRSDPCTCTYKFSEMMKRHSKSVMKKIRKDKPEPVLESLLGAPEQTKPKKSKSIKKSIEKVKESKARLVKGMQEGTKRSVTMIKETNSKVKENVEAAAKKSLEKMQETKQKIQEKIDSSKQKPEPITQNIEETTEEKKFKIKKDSLTKFREKLRRKRDLKDWECDFECHPEECFPEECFKILTRKRLRKIKDISVRRESTSAERREKKIGDKPKISEISIQVQHNKKPVKLSKSKRTTHKVEPGNKEKFDSSCLCVEIKKKDTKNTKERGTVPGQTTIKTKSETKVRKPKGSPQAVPAVPDNKEESKIPKQHSSGLKVENLKILKQTESRLEGKEMPQKARQAVRIGSSFSFNIEFYKQIPIVETPALTTRQDVRSIIKARQQMSRTKDGQNRPKKVHKKDKGSETTLNQSIKNIQATGHPLKRCFCTLKLKPRKPKTTFNVDKTNKKCVCPCTSPRIVKTETESVTESIQTNNKSELPYVLEPYECEPICLPEECDPIECEKRIRERNIRRHSVSMNTKKQIKSSSTITTKSASSASSRGFQVQTVRKLNSRPQREPVTSVTVTSAQKSSSSQRQAVRIGSSFSFQIEFSKGSGNTATPVIDNTILETERVVVEKPRREKSMPSAKRYIKHKYSQISSSTKTKFTSQKHKLRRCFCTLKLNRTEKKRKIISTTKGTITSGESEPSIPKPKPNVKTVSIATKKIRKTKVIVEPELLPYECEPGICIPGDCDTYECLEIIKKRKIKELKTKAHTSNTQHRKTKSTSSFAPKSVMRARTKKVQSTLVAYEDQVPSTKSAEKTHTPRRPLQVSNNINKQAVRIGSTFSFNVEFYKDKLVKDSVPGKVSQPSKIFVKPEKKPAPLRERGSQIADITQRKSVLMQAATKRKNVPIGPAMKRCFCTLKLRKAVKEAKKDVVDIGTKTPNFKTKQSKYPQLEPYECEPYVCIPGECNPYECLERIKKRKKRHQSREVGVIVKPSKMKSTSNSVQNVPIAIKDAFAQSKTVKQKVITTKIIQEPPTSDHIPKIQKQFAAKQPRQAVRLGSNFSFDIEFYKDRKSDESQITQIPCERGDVQEYKLLKNQGEQPNRAVMRQHESQVNVKRKHRATGVAPILKRCFCTLQLQKKKNQPIKSAQVFTVSRVGVTKPRFVNKQLALRKIDSIKTSIEKIDLYRTRIAPFHCSEISSCSLLPNSAIEFNSKRQQPLGSNNLHQNKNGPLISGPIVSQPIFRLNPYYARNNINYIKAPKAVRSLCTKNPSPTHNHQIKKFSELSLLKYYGYNKYYTSKSIQNGNEVSAYLKRQFCAMNIQVPKNYRNSPLTHKLKPYECEPGVCVPYECDPLVCQDRIMRRLMRRASKSSGTQQRLHSTSSTTLNTPHRSKLLQSNASFAPPRMTQSPPILRQKTARPGSQKQAVRVGSNFSFNIEFSKDKLHPSHVVKDVTFRPSTTQRPMRMTQKKIKHRGTRGCPKCCTDRDSQSTTKMEHRGSSAKPFLKRCFCTLKLHQKEKKRNLTDDKGVAVHNEIISVQTTDSTQNTEPQKYRKIRHSLEPYECEPGVCIPGECDPYECLELIKKRKLRGKDFGSGPIKLGRTSTASMTPTQRRKMRNRCNQLNCKGKRQHAQTYKQSVQSLDIPKSSRQAVRIGSTFSFNIEFFKENPNLQPRPSVAAKPIEYKTVPEVKRPKRTHDFKERFTQDDRSMHHKDSQSESMQHNIKSTMTSSFLKRCFCTAKLHRKEKAVSHSQDQTMNVNVEQQSSGSPTFLQRCLCVMKSLTAPKYKTGTPSQTEQETSSKPTHKPPAHRLEPYECEPGVCVPGECDPYVCEQLIRKRNAKVCTKETCTRRLRTRSQSSRIQAHRTPRAKQTQMTVKTNSKIVKPSSSGDFEKREQIEYSGSPGRQAVRIGSNFNFNIEFYKDRPTTEIFKEKPIADHYQRRRSSDDSRSFRPKTKSRGSYERKKHKRSRDSQVQKISKQDRASGVGQLLQRCFCTLNLRKHKVPKKYSEMGTQSMRMAIKEPPNISTKNVMTMDKRSPYKLEPYECEPNTCIPGQCDPYECEKRIKKRLRREYGTSTVPMKTKSATSMASSARKLKNMKIQSRKKKTRRNRTGTVEPRKPSYNKIDLPNTPSRQAVRIGSTFSFNIEFFKENNNEGNITVPPETKIRHKDVGEFDRNYKRRSSVPCNAKTCQARPRMREVDSQVLAKRMRSTMSGVTPFLKRCFCTLKLQKPITGVHGEDSGIQTQPWLANDYKSTYTRTPKKFNKPRHAIRAQNLDPYECEPGVCVPGECDPYECEKRIRMRDMRRHSVSSSTDRCQDSKCVATRTGYGGRKTHATSVPRERQKQKVTMSDRPRSLVRQSDLKPSCSPHRQAVRIGSNFSFDIEFYKDKSGNGSPKETYTPKKIYRPSEHKRAKERPKSNSRNMGAGNRGISFYHRKSQASGPKTETKGSGVGPFLKRCFCTLKLHKQGKQQKHPSVQMQVDYSPQPSSFDASTATKKQRRVLEPYECEPNVCVPGYCDPYECLRRIKRRQLKESGVATDRASMKSDYSLTSRINTRDQSLKTKHFKDKRLQRNVSIDKAPRSRPMRSSVAIENPNRQAVRIGSSFKFDIEFYKQTSTPHDQAHGDGQSYVSTAERKHKQRPRKLKTRGSQGKCSPRCQGVQMESAQRQSTGSGAAPLLKRCFCTLALQTTSKQPVALKQTKPIEEPRTKDMCTQSKCNFNKSKSLPYGLDPYECEPNVCIPGECDPYECYERIKRRNARYKSKGLSTDTKRYSQVSSMTTRYGKFSQSKRTQSVLLAKHRRQQRSSSVNDSMIVEQPRLQLFSDIANRNVVKIGSNFSFNIEFYKEVTPEAQRNFTTDRRESRPTIDTKQKYAYKTPNYRSRDSQAQTPKTHTRGSLVSNALKRCFCTAQLHKPNIDTSKVGRSGKCVECNPKPMFGQQQYQVNYHEASIKKKPLKKGVCTTCDIKPCLITKAQSVDRSGKCVEYNPKSIFGPQQYQVYYHKASIKKKPSKKCVCTTCDIKSCPNTKATSTKSHRRIKLKGRSTAKSKKIQNANAMETILPYAPNKFNKKASKTLISKKENKGTVGNENPSTQLRKSKQDKVSKNRRLKKSKSSKKLNVKKGKKDETEGKDAVTSTSSNLNKTKSFLCRCKQLFSKKNKNNTGTKPCIHICPVCKSDKTKKEPELPQAENLKKTKSERRPSKPNKKEPKKTKSLKIRNHPDLEEDRQDYSQFQSGDSKRKKKSQLPTKKPKDHVLPAGYKTNNLRCGDDYLQLYVTDLNQKLIKDNKKQVKFSDLNNVGGVTASANLTPKSVRKDKLPSKQKIKKSGSPKPELQKADCRTDSGSYLDIVLQPSYCSGTQLEGIAAISFKGDKSKTKRKSSQAEDSPCIPCKKKIGDEYRGASLSIPAKGSRKESTAPGGDIDQIIDKLTKNINAIKNAKSRILNTLITKEQICSCYSSVCECAKTIRKEKERAQKIEMELEQEKRLLVERERMRKEAEKAAKKRYKDFVSRQKRYEREDKMRRQKRIKENKYLADRLKNMKPSDVLLAVDSVMDIAKLGCSVVGDVGRSTCRFIQDPAYSCKKLKNAARDPVSMVKGAIDDSGLVATLKRVFMRISAMRGFRAMKSSMEENQFTGYLMNMAEADPRKRMAHKKKKEKKKQKDALDDFECSLYMNSLRKKRFIAVYYLCPWFYPHFITLLNVVEQVTDLILFLLAVFVWSPCILCMELCRAFVCCFLCTG